MEKVTMEKLKDICDGNLMNHVCLTCGGSPDNRCSSPGYGCSFAKVPTVSFEEMCRHIDRSRPLTCEMPLDEVLNKLKGY